MRIDTELLTSAIIAWLDSLAARFRSVDPAAVAYCRLAAACVRRIAGDPALSTTQFAEAVEAVLRSEGLDHAAESTAFDCLFAAQDRDRTGDAAEALRLRDLAARIKVHDRSVVKDA